METMSARYPLRGAAARLVRDQITFYQDIFCRRLLQDRLVGSCQLMASGNESDHPYIVTVRDARR